MKANAEACDKEQEAKRREKQSKPLEELFPQADNLKKLFKIVVAEQLFSQS